MAEHFGEDPKDLVVDAVDDRCGDGLTPLSGFISSIRPNVEPPRVCRRLSNL